MIEKGVSSVKYFGAMSDLMEQSVAVSKWIACKDDVEWQIPPLYGRDEVSGIESVNHPSEFCNRVRIYG